MRPLKVTDFCVLVSFVSTAGVQPALFGIPVGISGTKALCGHNQLSLTALLENYFVVCHPDEYLSAYHLIRVQGLWFG